MVDLVGLAGAPASLLPGSFSTLKPINLLQHRQAAGWSTATVSAATVALATFSRSHSIRAGTLLNLSQGVLQTGQRIIPGVVLVSLVSLLIEVQSGRVGAEAGRRLRVGGGGWNWRVDEWLDRWGCWHLALGNFG